MSFRTEDGNGGLLIDTSMGKRYSTQQKVVLAFSVTVAIVLIILFLLMFFYSFQVWKLLVWDPHHKTAFNGNPSDPRNSIWASGARLAHEMVSGPQVYQDGRMGRSEDSHGPITGSTSVANALTGSSARLASMQVSGPQNLQ